MSLVLKIRIEKIDQVKTLRFAAAMSISEAIEQIRDKSDEGGQDHGLFQPGEGRRPSRWLRRDKTLQFYDLKANDYLIYRKRHRPLKVLCVDNTTKMVLIDDSAPVGDVVTAIGKKMLLKNPEEFSLMTTTREPNVWLDPQKTLAEQGVDDQQAVLLKKKWFVSDASITEDDAVQLHLVYAQGVDAVIRGEHALKDEEAIQFAALQCQAQFGNFNAAMHKPGFLKDKIENFMSEKFASKKDIEASVFKEYRLLSGMSETKAKYRYVQLIRSLRTYGITYYEAQLKPKTPTMKPVPIKIGITATMISKCDPKGQVLKEHKLGHMRRWAAAPKSFTLDFGDYDDDIWALLTDEGDAMSQQIAGYIDILLKKRSEEGQIISEDDMEVGNVVSAGVVRGQAMKGFTSSTSSGAGGRAGQMDVSGGAQRGVLMSGGFQPRAFKIENLDGAANAVRTMLDDSGQAGAPPPNSQLTAQQWQQQLANHGENVVLQGSKLHAEVKSMNPDNIDAALLAATARQLALVTGNMLAAAHSTAGAMGGDEHLLATARAVADAVARLLAAADEVTKNPNDAEKRRALDAAMKALEDNKAALLAATKGFTTTKADQELLLAAAKAVADATARLLQSTQDTSKSMQSANHKRTALQEAQASLDAAQSLLNACRTIGPVALDPDCRGQLMRATRSLEAHIQTLMSASKNAGGDAQSVEDLLAAARSVSDAIAHLLLAADAAEANPLQNVAKFAETAKKLQTANTALAASVGQPAEILKHTKSTAGCSGEVVVAAKLMAKNAADESDRKRLLDAARRVADATKRLVDDAKKNSQQPHDEAARARLTESSRGLALATTQLVGDAARQAAQQNLRARAKDAVAATTALVSLARSGRVDTGDGDIDGQMQLSADEAFGAAGSLLNAVAQASKAQDDAAKQAYLAGIARTAAPVAFSLVTACKASGPRVLDAKGKQELLVAAKAAAEAIKGLIDATKEIAAVSGAAEIESAMELLAVEDAAIDASLLKADSGMITPDAVKKPAAMQNLSGAANRLGSHAKSMAQCAASAEKLGSAATATATEAVAVTSAARQVASHCEQRTASELLNKSKKVNQSATKLMDAAAQAAQAGGAGAATANLLAAAKLLAQTLAELADACSESEPGSKECEQAAIAVQQAAQELGARGSSRVDFKQASIDLASVAKAMSGAAAQVATAAQRNKRQLATAANTVARTYPQVVAAANVAAASATEPDAARQITHRAALLAEALAAELRAAKLASPEDASTHSSLQEATQAVNDAVGDLLKLCDTTNPGQRELSSALETVRSALDRLNGGAAPSAARSVDDLQRAASELDKASDGVAQACLKGGTHVQLIPPAKAVARAIDVIADATATAANLGAKQRQGGAGSKAASTNKLTQPASRTHDAIKQLIDACNAGDKASMVSSAKSIAMSCGELVGGARAMSNDLKSTDAEVSRQLLNAAQPVANATAKLVTSTKASAQQPSPAATQATVSSAHALADAVDALLAAAPYDDASSASASGAAASSESDPTTAALLASARSLAFQVAQLLQASQGVVDQSGVDKAEMTSVVGDIHNNVAALLVAARDAQPGFRELATAIASVESSVSDLDNAAIDADVGILAPTGDKTLPQCHQALAPLIKQMATDVQAMLKAIKEPKSMGLAAVSLSAALSSAVSECKDAASLSSEPTTQLTPAIDAASKILSTMRMLQEQAQPQAIAPVAKGAMEAVVAMLQQMRGGGAGGAAIDEALAAARAATTQIEAARNGAKAKAPWESARAQLSSGVQGLDSALASAFGTGQRNAKNLPPTTSGLGSAITQIAAAAVDIAAHIGDDAARDDFVHSAGTVASSLAAFLEQTKALYNEPSNADIRDAFGTANSNVAGSLRMLTDAVDDADGGAAACKAAIDRLGAIGNELSQTALMAVAGAFDDVAPADVEFEAIQAKLAQIANAAATSVVALGGATRKGPAAMASAAKAVQTGAGDSIASGARSTAAAMGDARAQARLLNAACDVAVAAQAAVAAAKATYVAADDVDAQKKCGAAIEVVKAKVATLIKVSTEAEAEASAVAIELDKARQYVLGLVQEFPKPTFKVNAKATPVTLVTAAVGLAESSAALVASCGVAQDDVIGATKNSVRAVENILRDAKQAATTAPNDAAKQQLARAATNTADALAAVFVAAKAHSKRQTIAGKRKLGEASDALIDRIGELVDAVALLPNAAEAVRMYRSGEDLETLATRALADAARRISDAQRKIVASVGDDYAPGAPEQALNQPKLEHAMGDASHGLAGAVGGVVQCATAAQDALRQTAGGGASAFKRDPTWAKGLITSANDLAVSVDDMAGVAIKAIAQQICDKDEVEKVAKNVAAMSARLVASSRAKADPDSSSQQQLAAAQKRVAQISAILVAVGKEYEEFLQAPPVDPLKVEEEAIQQQIKILQLQKKIAKQKAAMARVKGEPAPAAAPAGRGAPSAMRGGATSAPAMRGAPAMAMRGGRGGM